MNNEEWTEPRYGIEPGEENAYILMETPDAPGVAKDHVLLGRLSQVLEIQNARAHIQAFLADHPEVHQPWPELERLEGKDDLDSRLRRVELLVDEGRTKKALAVLSGIDTPRASLLRSRAHRIDGDLEAAAKELSRVGAAAMAALGAEGALERIRVAFEREEDATAAKLLDRFLEADPAPEQAAEAYWLRGWLHHRSGDPEKAIEVWLTGIERHPPETALYSQKAYFTMIRTNWELPDNVDQPY